VKHDSTPRNGPVLNGDLAGNFSSRIGDLSFVAAKTPGFHDLGSSSFWRSPFAYGASLQVRAGRAVSYPRPLIRLPLLGIGPRKITASESGSLNRILQSKLHGLLVDEGCAQFREKRKRRYRPHVRLNS